MKRSFIPSLLLLIFFLSPAKGFSQTDYSGRREVYRATPTKTTEIHHTKLRVSFNYQKETMDGEEWLSASPFFYPTDSLTLDAKAMLIHEVAMEKEGKKIPLENQYKDDLLKIKLDKTYNRDQEYRVYIRYTARPNEVKQKGGKAIRSAKGLYFINAQGKDPNKPIQIWTQGETEASSCWFPTIDKPNQKSTGEIYMTVPDRYVSLSNGFLKESKKEANGLRTDHWVMDKKHAPYLFFMAVGDYAVVKDTWRDRVPVDYYVEKEYAPYAKDIFGNTPEMMEFFSKKLNYDYPWNKYAQITARDYVSGAMENTTATIHMEAAQQKPGDLIDENRWEPVIAHELFHHWFGDLVTAESWSNLTVNESFANYSEYLWLEYKYGKDDADYHLMTDIDRYKHRPEDHVKNLVRFDYSSNDDVFDAVSYNKGGGILHMLRNYLGDEAFFIGLNDYLKTHEYGTAEAHQLRLSMEKVTGKDLNWFFNQWYFGSAHPKLEIEHFYEPVKKQLCIEVKQEQGEDKLFQFPLAIDIYEHGKPKRQHVWVNAKTKSTFLFSVAKQPELVVADADQVLLAEIKHANKTSEEYYRQYSLAKEFKSRYLALKEASEHVDSDAKALAVVSTALKDPFFRLRIQALNALDLSQRKHAKVALSKVVKMSKSEDKTLVQAAAIRALSKTKDKKYIPLYEKALDSPSNSVKISALDALSKIIPAEKVAILSDKIDLNYADDELLLNLLPIILEYKIETHMTAIASIVGFYPFIATQRPELSESLQEAYHWIMSGDHLSATEKITKTLSSVSSEIHERRDIKDVIVSILEGGLNKKMEALQAEPNSASLERQVALILETIELYK